MIDQAMWFLIFGAGLVGFILGFGLAEVLYGPSRIPPPRPPNLRDGGGYQRRGTSPTEPPPEFRPTEGRIERST